MSIPYHVAIIPDGNRRWAKSRNLKPWDGHTEGVKLFWETAYAALDAGISNITFWAGSYDNLIKRSKIEIKFLIKLIVDELTEPKILNECLDRKVRFRILGEWRQFITDKKTIAAIEKLQNETSHFRKTFTTLFAYDGRREMLSAINDLVRTNKKATEEALREKLWTGELPDVDLVIRTGGEPHWSAGFLMWQTSNSQFYFTEKLWPDFKNTELKKALEDYERRERRLGK
jgi:undecaprenyl diphosphate synthase